MDRGCSAASTGTLNSRHNRSNYFRCILAHKCSKLKTHLHSNLFGWRSKCSACRRRRGFSLRAAWPLPLPESPPHPPAEDIYQFVSSGTVMQWSVLSRSTMIHQALQIVPVWSWRGSSCVQIMSLTPPVRGVGGGGLVRHGRLALPTRETFYRPTSLPQTRRNHWILTPGFFFLLFTLPSAFSLSFFDFSLFFFRLIFILYLFIICPSACSLPFSSLSFCLVWLLPWFSEWHHTDCSMTDAFAASPVLGLLQAWLAFTAAAS